MRIRKTLALAATAALVAACGTTDDDPAAQAPDAQEAPDDGAAPDADGDDPAGEQPELTDPNEQIADGDYRGEGVVLPVPDGWRLDEMAFAQGLVLAMSEGGAEQIYGQAINVDDVPEDLEFDQFVDQSRNEFGTEPSRDEEVELEGATQAHLLRFDDLPGQQEGQPEATMLVVIADDGEGHIGVFSYAAASDDFDEANAELLLDHAGFDPDSEPSPPAPMGELGEPAPQG